MTSILRSMLPVSSRKDKYIDDDDDDYCVEYSFAMEYTGPPVSHNIPKVVPVDIRRIPTAAEVASSLMLSNLKLPVIQPIVKKSSNIDKIVAEELKSDHDEAASRVSSGVYSRDREEGCIEKGELAVVDGGVSSKSIVLDGIVSSCSSGTLGFSDDHNNSNQLSASSDVEELDDDCKVSVSDGESLNLTVSDSAIRSPEILPCEEEENCLAEPGHGNRTPVVTFRDSPSNDVIPEKSHYQEADVVPERPVVSDVKKGLCNRCHKKSRYGEKEVCLVCGAKYCRKCVLRAMGSMPEGRKCITCIGYQIDESKRGSLGKCSGMLRKLLSDAAVKQIMRTEISCGVNQLPPQLICVNDKPLSTEELVILQSCPIPPKKLRPGNYWYDKVSGFWGKAGEKPHQIITADLAVGYSIKQDASNGNTNVLINNREITKQERFMLQVAGIHCEGRPHFWVTADGSYQHEGMNYVMGKLWEKRKVKMICTALSLPFLTDRASAGNAEGVATEMNKANPKNLEKRRMNKLLLVGCDQSGTSTIFKQVKILYDVPFSDDEKQNIKFMIQRNLYRYIAILLEAHERFAEDHEIEMRRLLDEPGPSERINQVGDMNMYTLSPKLKNFSSWLLQVTTSGNLEAIFPAATREYAPVVEELWKDKAFQATYKRRNELPMLPRVANYFLDRAVEISLLDYEPSEMDILYAEGITSSNGIASVEFSLPKSSHDVYMESSDHNDPSKSYQLIRIHASSLGENCKWLDMFEDVDLVIFSVSLTEYDEYHEDINGVRTNKMLSSKKLFETIVTHPTLAEKDFLLVLNKFDLLEEKVGRVPLTECDWFQDFAPVISLHPHNAGSNNPPLAQRAFHYMAVKFKRLFDSLTTRKLFVSKVTGLEADSVDKAIRYAGEILKWDDERHVFSTHEYSTESVERSTSE